jgi:hypothetical protein
MLLTLSAPSSLPFRLSSATVQGLPSQNMASITQLRCQFLRKLYVWIRSSAHLKKPELSAVRTHPRLRHSTLFLNRTGLCVLAAIIVDSISPGTHNRYPLPSILDLSARLHGCRFFSCINLVKGYHQVPMDPSDIAKTTIITPFGSSNTYSCLLV